MPIDPDTGSESVVRLIEMGPVSGFNSVLAWGGLGLIEGDEDILSLHDESSGSASGVGRDTTTYCCFRREGDCREEN